MSTIIKVWREVKNLNAATAPSQLGFYQVKIALTRELDHQHRKGAFLDPDRVVVVEFNAGLAIKCDQNIRSLFLKDNCNDNRIRNYQGSDCQGKWSDGCQNDAGNRRVNNRSAGCKGICG